MLSKYCPAGKCECGKFHEPNKCSGLDPHFCETNLENIEQCPWPSRQKPVVESETPESNLKKNLTDLAEIYNAGKADGYRKGQEEMKGRVIGAVKLELSYWDESGKNDLLCDYNDVLKLANALEVEGE